MRFFSVIKCVPQSLKRLIWSIWFFSNVEIRCDFKVNAKTAANGEQRIRHIIFEQSKDLAEKLTHPLKSCSNWSSADVNIFRMNKING